MQVLLFFFQLEYLFGTQNVTFIGPHFTCIENIMSQFFWKHDLHLKKYMQFKVDSINNQQIMTPSSFT